LVLLSVKQLLRKCITNHPIKLEVD